MAKRRMSALATTKPRRGDQCLSDLEALDHAVQERATAGTSEVILLRSVSSADGERAGGVAYIRPEQRPLIDAKAERINAIPAGFDDRELRLTIIARLLQTET
jgi:hypothetical protein